MSTVAREAAGQRERWLLRLYVAGSAPKSLDAFANLKEICERYLPGQYDIEIIDLIEHPTMAAADNILAVPTLVRLRPAPVGQLIGNLSDTERVLSYLRVPGRNTR